jgi:hypothetical protein
MVASVFICLYAIPGTAACPCVWHTLEMSAPDSKDKAEVVKSNDDAKANNSASDTPDLPKEIGGRGGLDPTRYGDWEKAGRCIDF